MFIKKRLPPEKINLLYTERLSKATPAKTRPFFKHRFKKIIAYCSIFIIVLITGFSTKIIISSTEVARHFSGSGLLSQLRNFLIKDTHDIAGAPNERVNILLVGVAGSGHEGAYLTDTIILASLDMAGNRAALISIPRDLYVRTSTFGGTKINALYTFAQAQGLNGGDTMQEAIKNTFNIDVHYFALIDFSGFVELVNVLGGIDVFVERSFTDTKFPTADFKVRTIHFERGIQHLNGEQALQFARSRHGNNQEGSDFARAARQQKIILAVKEKVWGLNMVFRPDKINKIITLIGDSIETDMEIWEAAKLIEIVKDVKKEDITQIVLDDSPAGQLRATIGIDGAFLLVPKNRAALFLLAENIFISSDIKKENPKVVIQNGTITDGLANSMKTKLEKEGFTVVKVENAAKQSYAKTVIFDLADGEKNVSRERLKALTNANISTYVPEDIWRGGQDADFIVIVGNT